MKNIFASVAVAALLAVPALAMANVVDFGVDYSASQSLWGGGGSAGFHKSGRTSGDAGLYYDARASTGNVSANVSGRISTTYDDTVNAGDNTTVTFDFLGDGNASSLSSSLGASVSAGVFFPFFGDREVDLIGQGFSIAPSRNFTAGIDQKATASDAEEAAGAKSLSIAGYSLGPSLNVDVVQDISLTPTSLAGMLLGHNLTTNETMSRSVAIPDAGPVSTSFALSAGLWDFTLVDFSLANLFTNKIDVGFRPAVDYVFGSWPPPGQGFNYNMINSSFGLNFNTIASVGNFNIDVKAPVSTDVPGPGSLWVFVVGLVILLAGRRRSMRSLAMA